MTTLLAALLLATTPVWGDLHPFSDEKNAARAFEVYMFCLADHSMELEKDKRDDKALAAEVINACTVEATALRAHLSDVYRRNPALIAEGESATDAADKYVNGAQARMEVVFRESRKRHK